MGIGVSAGNRMPSGRQRVIKPRHAGANNIAKRIADNFKVMLKLGMDARWATAIGKLHLMGELTELEVQAAWRYAEIVAQHDHFLNTPRRAAKSQAYEISRGEIDELERHRVAGTVDDYERRARRAKKRHDRADKALADLGGFINTVAVDNGMPAENSIPALKLGLGRLIAEFDMRVYSEPAAVENRQLERALDVKRRVTLAVETVDGWLRDDGAVPETFREGAASEGQRGVSVWGRDRTGNLVKRLVLIRCRTSEIVAHIDSLFVKACQAKGWKDHVG